jgi:hypothetical protein
MSYRGLPRGTYDHRLVLLVLDNILENVSQHHKTEGHNPVPLCVLGSSSNSPLMPLVATIQIWLCGPSLWPVLRNAQSNKQGFKSEFRRSSSLELETFDAKENGSPFPHLHTFHMQAGHTFQQHKGRRWVILLVTLKLLIKDMIYMLHCSGACPSGFQE